MQSRVGVYCIVTRGEQVLLVKHARPTPWFGKWILPGGKLRPGELIEECCVREILEETGLSVIPQGLVAAFISSASIEKKVPKWIVYIVLLGKHSSGELRVKEKELREAKWVHFRDLPSHELHQDTLKALRQAGLYRQVQTTL